jgi:hypothetical protein
VAGSFGEGLRGTERFGGAFGTLTPRYESISKDEETQQNSFTYQRLYNPTILFQRSRDFPTTTSGSSVYNGLGLWWCSSWGELLMENLRLAEQRRTFEPRSNTLHLVVQPLRSLWHHKILIHR